MAWLPSHQELRDHPKVRKAAVALGVPRPNLIGHLHCLWWWALSYAPDGDVSKYDDVDLAIAAEWDGDPAAFVAALTSCGSADRSGFIDADRRLHDWDQYAGRYDAQKRAADGALGNHVRWHEKRGVIDESCSLCVAPESGASPLPSGGESQGDRGANRREEERRGEEKDFGASDKPKPKRATTLPEDWQPNANHVDLAVGLDLRREVEQFADHHRAKGSTMKDWDAAFRTWLRNAKQFAPRHLKPVPVSSTEHRVVRPDGAA